MDTVWHLSLLILLLLLLFNFIDGRLNVVYQICALAVPLGLILSYCDFCSDVLSNLCIYDVHQSPSFALLFMVSHNIMKLAKFIDDAFYPLCIFRYLQYKLDPARISPIIDAQIFNCVIRNNLCIHLLNVWNY